MTEGVVKHYILHEDGSNSSITFLTFDETTAQCFRIDTLCIQVFRQLFDTYLHIGIALTTLRTAGPSPS